MATKMNKSTIVKSTKSTTTSAPKVSRARKSDTVTIAPAADAIAQRAYERFVERGYQHGHDVEDWLLAERDLTQPA